VNKFNIVNNVQFAQQYGTNQTIKIASCYQTKFSVVIGHIELSETRAILIVCF